MDKKRYTLKVYRRTCDDYDNEETVEMGDYITYAYSAKQAFSNICYREGFRNHSTAYEYIEYFYEIVEIEEGK